MANGKTMPTYNVCCCIYTARFEKLLCLFLPNACQQAVHTLIAVQRRYLESLGKLSQAEEDTIWQVIIGQRAEVSLVKFIMLNKFVCQLVCFILIFFIINFIIICETRNVSTDVDIIGCRAV